MAEEKKGMNKGLIALAIVGGFLALKFLKKRKAESRGYCEKMGEKIDKSLGDLACKADELIHHAKG